MKSRLPPSPRRGNKGKWYAHPSGYNLELAAQKRARAIEYAERVRQNLKQKGTKQHLIKETHQEIRKDKLLTVEEANHKETLLEKTQRTMKITNEIHQFIQEHRNINHNLTFIDSTNYSNEMENENKEYPIRLDPKLLEVKSIRHIINEQSEFLSYNENINAPITNKYEKSPPKEYDRSLVRLPTESQLIYPDGHTSAAATPDTSRRRFIPAPLLPV